MKEQQRSVDEIFQEMYEKRMQQGLGATGAPIRRISRFLQDILGHTDYDNFWQEILDNNPGRKR